MNWGNRLLIVFGLFALFIGFLVYKCFNTKFDLVSKDYYKDELRYQEKIDGKNNAAEISALQINQNSDSVTVVFPVEQKGMKADGEIYFYCPTNENRDKHFPLAIDAEGKQTINKKELGKGLFNLKITWNAGAKKFFYEKDIKIS